MDDQAPVRNIEHPIFRDLGAGVEGGFLLQVEGEGGVGDFGDEQNVRCAR